MRTYRIHNDKQRLRQRRALRSALTPAEAALWRLLKESQLHGRKFRRQHGIGNYVVDFYCPAERLIVELDGAAHESEIAFARDRIRERFFNSVGLKVLRIENRQVFKNPDGVLQLIAQHFRR